MKSKEGRLSRSGSVQQPSYWQALVRWVPLAWCLASAAPRLSAQQGVGDEYLFRALNASRVQAGLPALVWDARVAQAAGQHVEAMLRQGTLTHQVEGEADLPARIEAADLRFTVVSENIGVAADADELHSIWMHSQGHRDNMLDPTITSVGIALVASRGDLWAVEDFAYAIPELSMSQQEARVEQLVRSLGVTAAASDAARDMCSAETGYVGRRPAFVMRFQSAGLTRLPAALLQRLRRGKVSQAAVGACAHPADGFAPYRIAVVLYP